MAGAQYLKRRVSGIYFVRLCVPARLKAAVGKCEIHRSTGCRDLRLAKIVAAELAVQWHSALEKLERMDPAKIVAGSIDLLAEGVMPLQHAAALLGADAAVLAQQLAARRAPFFVEAEDWEGWLIDDMSRLWEDRDETGLVSVDVTEAQLARHGTRRRIRRSLVLRHAEEAVALARGSAAVAVCQFMVWPSREIGFVVPLPGRTITAEQLEVRRSDVEALRGSLAAQITPDMTASARAPDLSAKQRPADSCAAPRWASMQLSELVARYLERNQAAWRPATLHTNREACELFVDLAEDPALAVIDRDWLWNLSQHAKQLPHNRHLVRRELPPGAGASILLAYARERGLPTLTPRALEKLTEGFSKVLHWARKQGYLKDNPAVGLGNEVFAAAGGKRGRANNDRDMLDADDLRKIFSARWFQHGVGERTREGKFYAYRPHYYWLPLLGLYTGGRINELSQLHLTDVRSSPDGTAYLDFNNDGEDKLNVDDDDVGAAGGDDASDGAKTLKTVNACRQVPLHPELLRLGFIDYVEALRAASFTRVFPELKFDATKGYGRWASKWFNERFMGEQLGIARNGRKTFHSLRHNFATALGDTGVSSLVRAQLMGHAKGAAQADKVYDKGRSVAALLPHIEALQFHLPAVSPFRVDEAMQAVRDAIALKQTRRPRVV